MSYLYILWIISVIIVLVVGLWIGHNWGFTKGINKAMKVETTETET